MLLLIKKAGETGISKRALMDNVSASSQSIHNWRTAYKNGGIESLLLNGRKGKAGRPSVFSKEQQIAISKKLNDPRNNLRGYKELQTWIQQEFEIDVKYNTILVYSIRKHKSSVKVARKSHVKKDEQLAEIFKKTSVKR
jgi:transposase